VPQLKFSHRPDGKTADVLARLTFAKLRTLWSTLLQFVRATDTLQFSHRPVAKIAEVLARLTLAQLRTLWSTLLQHVRATDTLHIFHRPDGEFADTLASTHACTTTNASVNYRRCVPQRPVNFPSPPRETHVLRVVCRAPVSMSMMAQ
jgi:hypothetical protein